LSLLRKNKTFLIVFPYINHTIQFKIGEREVNPFWAGNLFVIKREQIILEEIMRSLIIYDSYFGNTEKLAQAVGKALGSEETVNVVRFSEVTLDQLEGIDLLVLASPTRGFRPSEGTTKFLNSLSADALNGIKAAAFDTRIDTETIKNKAFRFIVKKGGYAGPSMAKQMEKKGAQIIQPLGGFFVDDSEGPVSAGEMERAVEWAAQIKAAAE
jgi:flavodoxin I